MEVKTEHPWQQRENVYDFAVAQKIMEEGTQMRDKELIQAIIGAGGFVLKDVTDKAASNKINLGIRSTKWEQYRCSICHRKVTLYDKDRGRRRWQFPDMGVR